MSKLSLVLQQDGAQAPVILSLLITLGYHIPTRDAIGIPFRLHVSQLAGHGIGLSTLYKEGTGVHSSSENILVAPYSLLGTMSSSLTCEKQYVIIPICLFSLETKHRAGNPIHQEFLMETVTWALKTNVSDSSSAVSFKILQTLRVKEIRGYVMFDESGCFTLAGLFLCLITQTQ